MQVNGTLREIHLSKHGMTDTGAEWICRMLKENKTLTLLDLSWYDSSLSTYIHVLYKTK